MSHQFWGKFTSGSRISASRSDLLKLPNELPAVGAAFNRLPTECLEVEWKA